MPYAPHLRVTALGTLGNGAGVERFSYGFTMVNKSLGIPFFAPDAAVWADLAEDVRAFHARPDTHLSAMAILREVKIASIGVDGKYTAAPAIVNVVDTPGTHGFSYGYTSPQSALAVSLVTARRGPTGKGRFYLPMPIIAPDPATLLLSLGDVEGVRTSTVQLVNDLNNLPGVDVANLEVGVASTKGYNTLVRGVRCGRVMDTVRSRRRQLDENYTTVALVVVD